MSPGPLALLIPVLIRPHRVEPLLSSIAENTPPGYRVLFIASPGDVSEIVALESAGACPLDHVPTARRAYIEVEGNYATKINAGIAHTDEPLLFIGADDLAFHPGWLEAAHAVMVSERAGVVGTQDLANPRVIRGEHATHFLVHRSYVEEYGTIDEPGKLLHEGYQHEYVDNELIETAQARNAYAFAGESVVEHLHPIAGKAPMDELYAGARERMKAGRRLFAERRSLWQDPGA